MFATQLSYFGSSIDAIKKEKKKKKKKTLLHSSTAA